MMNIEEGKRCIFIDVGEEKVIFDKEKKVFTSCTCKGEVYKRGPCKHKKEAMKHLISIGKMEDDTFG